MRMVLERNLFEDGARCIGTPVSIRKAFARMSTTIGPNSTIEGHQHSVMLCCVNNFLK